MANPLVVDCSAVIPWFLQDEANSWSERLLQSLSEWVLHAPALWQLEFSNVLLMAERRKRIDAESRQGLLQHASRLPMVVDASVVTLLEISHLADKYGLTTYDAAYLELALRLGCPLATQDKTLKAAARKLGLAY